MNKWNPNYEKHKAQLLKLNPNLKNCCGIYIFTRTEKIELHNIVGSNDDNHNILIKNDDESGISSFYVGQSIHILDRCIEHMSGFQHIDLSIKKRGLYSEDNPYGWRLGFIEYNKEDLDMMEQYWILRYQKAGYQARYNKTTGSQGSEKEQLNEFRPAKTYRDGLEQGRINSSREISHLFDKHLTVSTKKDPPTKHQLNALDKFNDFLNYHKSNREDNIGGD